MANEVKFQNNRLRDYSSLFSRNEALSWLKMDFSSVKIKLDRYDKRWLTSTYLEYLRYIYSILAVNYQNEYVFKNEFLNKWLLTEIGDNNSKVFNEFRIGNSIADLVMMNGNSKVFEIKTEYDSDIRLPVQIENYQKVFNQIYLVIPEAKLRLYEKYKEQVGIITYKSGIKNSFDLHNEAVMNSEIDYKTIMNILHTKEYKSIVKNHYGKIPKMTSFSQFKLCSELILKIPKGELNHLFIAEIKKREVNNSSLSTRYYKEFNQLFLALKMNRDDKNKMINLLKTPIQQ